MGPRRDRSGSSLLRLLPFTPSLLTSFSASVENCGLSEIRGSAIAAISCWRDSYHCDNLVARRRRASGQTARTAATARI